MKPTTIKDIMNAKLLYIAEGDRPLLARRKMLEFGVHCVPILDDTHRPVGMISLRDLAGKDGEHFHPSGGVTTIRSSASIEEGAKALLETEYHHLVVVDERGVAVGMVSAVDFLRSMIGAEARHPKAFDQF